MRIKLILIFVFSYILLSAHFFEGGECGKKKRLLKKAAKILLLGAALKGSKKIIPIPLPIPIPFKSEKHFVHSYPEPMPYPVYKPYPEPIFIHDSYGSYHDNYW